jgi:ferredoxin
VDEKFTVYFNENDPTARYQATNLEPLTMAGGKASNPEKYQAQDPRCVAGPIPLECQTGACGTCWVGVLGGGENLNEISPFEAKRLEKIGYPYDGSERPPIRLACKSLCQGPISIVIPPWSGVLSYLPRFEENVARAERPEAAAAK